MHFDFTTLSGAIGTFFHVAKTAPEALAETAETAVNAAAPVIDQIAGPGTAAKVTHDIETTKQAAIDFLTPHLQEAAMAETLLQGLTTILTAGAVKHAAVSLPTAD